MRRALCLVAGLLVVTALAGAAQAGVTKALFSEASGSIGLQVTLLASDTDYAQLTFVNHPIDGAILDDAVVGGDPSIGWDVNFGPLLVDRTSRVVNGAFAEYALAVPVAGQTLTVVDGVTTRLNGTVGVGTLYTKTGGNFGGMDAPKGLTVNSIAYDGSSVFEEFSNYLKLDWGFAYSGLDLDAWLQAPPGSSGWAASSGYIMIPEPATLALVLFGAGAVLVRRRRQ